MHCSIVLSSVIVFDGDVITRVCLAYYLLALKQFIGIPVFLARILDLHSPADRLKIHKQLAKRETTSFNHINLLLTNLTHPAYLFFRNRL